MCSFPKHLGSNVGGVASSLFWSFMINSYIWMLLAGCWLIQAGVGWGDWDHSALLHVPHIPWQASWDKFLIWRQRFERAAPMYNTILNGCSFKSANIPLAKASDVAELNVKWWNSQLPMAGEHCKVTGRSEELGPWLQSAMLCKLRNCILWLVPSLSVYLFTYVWAHISRKCLEGCQENL